MRKRRSFYLPLEIWEQVFAKLDEIDIRQLSLVSKQFLSTTNSFKSVLKISNQTLPIFPRVLLRFQNLEKIIICTKPGFSLLCILHHISRSRLTYEARKRLKKLEFRYPTSFSLEDNFDIISNVFPMQEEISFINVKFSKYILSTNGFQKLANLKNLKTITFEGDCSFLSDKSIISLSSNSKDLEKLDIRTFSHNVTENAIGFVMRNSHKLTSLTLSSVGDPRYNSPFSIKNSIVYAKSLHTLCLYDRHLSNEILCSIAEANPPLKKLRISHANYIGRDTLSMLFQSVCSIEDLHLKILFLDGSIFYPISQYLTKLTRIDLGWCQQLNNHCFFLLLNSCPLLEEIKMENANVGCGEFSPTEFHKYGRIRSLSLCGNRYLDDKMLKIIARVCPNLHFLNISCSNQITGKGISKILKSCRFLTHLDISYLHVSSIFGKLSKGRSLNLKVLKARFSKLNDKAMCDIGRLCSDLEFLDISKCPSVTEVGIMEVVRNCKKLEQIDISSLRIVGIDELNLMAQTRSSLKKIFVMSPNSVPSEDHKNIYFKYGCKILCELSALMRQRF